MKNLQIGDNDLIGNRFNGHDLHKYLLAKNISSEHIVWTKQSNDNHTHEIYLHQRGRDAVRNSITYLENIYGAHSFFHPFSYELLFNPLFLETDTVHLHLIHNKFFNINHLPILTKLKPTIWTLHDPWPTTGHCIYSMDCDRWESGCGNCPDLNIPFALNHDTTALNWEIKKLAIQQSQLDIIVASQWMMDRVNKSPIFNGKRVHLVPFGLDLTKIKPGDASAAKAKLNIPVDNVVLAMRTTESPFKGTQFVVEALKQLETTKNITILTFNTKGLLKDLSSKYHILELGWIHDEDEMIQAYNAADIFLMPSTAEAFGMMAMESMACGKPSIVMSGTSLEEVIKPSEGGGITVPQGDIAQFTHAIKELSENQAMREQIGITARKLAEKHYNIDRYLADILAVYDTAISNHQSDDSTAFILSQQSMIAKTFNLTTETPQIIFAKHRWIQLKTFLKRFKIMNFLYYKIYKRFKS